ncbi:hypothetical protein [Lyngbya confervoides]|nr:hypothetical protein [Lyngbya confervoides]
MKPWESAWMIVAVLWVVLAGVCAALFWTQEPDQPPQPEPQSLAI